MENAQSCAWTSEKQKDGKKFNGQEEESPMRCQKIVFNGTRTHARAVYGHQNKPRFYNNQKKARGRSERKKSLSPVPGVGG